MKTYILLFSLFFTGFPMGKFRLKKVVSAVEAERVQ